MNTSEFSTLALSPSMLHNLKELGFTQTTPIQSQALPLILEGKDLIAQAQTGSGKTAAFGIGLLEKLDVKKYTVQALVLCPTRELADQVAKELRRLARATHNVKILTLSGGVAFGPQLGSLRHGAHIIVGTPGRVLKHMDKGSLSLATLETLVLDEADRMLDMGFIEDIEKVIAATPKGRQTLLFSATYPDAIMSLSRSIQNDAVMIKSISQEKPNQIQEYFVSVALRDKLATVINILAHYQPQTAIIFSNTKMDAQEIADTLYARGVDALAIHGDLEQFERTDVLVQFSNRSCLVLVATDVAARGIDIKELGMVINFELPHDEATYTHRIGRTGRAGEAGLAFTLYADDARDIEFYRDAKRTFIEAKDLPTAKDFTMPPPNATLVIEGGKKDKVRAGDILGALTGEAGIEGKYIGKIDINDKQSYVAIAKSHIESAEKKLKRGRIKGKNFSVWMLRS